MDDNISHQIETPAVPSRKIKAIKTGLILLAVLIIVGIVAVIRRPGGKTIRQEEAQRTQSLSSNSEKEAPSAQLPTGSLPLYFPDNFPSVTGDLIVANNNFGSFNPPQSGRVILSKKDIEENYQTYRNYFVGLGWQVTEGSASDKKYFKAISSNGIIAAVAVEAYSQNGFISKVSINMIGVKS